MRIKQGYKVREMAGENVVVARGRGAVDLTNIITLNDSALLLWNALADREFEAEDAARILLDNYSVEALTFQLSLPVLSPSDLPTPHPPLLPSLLLPCSPNV